MDSERKLGGLLAPPLIFPALFIPYQWVNATYIVKWFGCGCPKTDEYGNIIPHSFNANHFTLLFWLLIAVIVMLIAVFKAKRLTKWYSKAIYLTLTAAVSLGFVWLFAVFFHWK